ncbi:hypothetical protein BH24CHL9_BH24CHL9_00910 [soil metagenome]
MADTMTISDVVHRALDAYEALASLGEDVEEEWTYVNDLRDAWMERLEEVVAARGGEAVDPVAQAGVDRLIDEMGSIGDAHRAIDWLSTFPQVLLTAIGEQP